jgi:hypothetical protein
LSYDPHQHLRFFLAIDLALPAIRTALAMLQVLVLDLDFLCATECLSPVAPVPLGRGGGELSSGCGPASFPGSSDFGSTAFVFSVFRGRTSIAARAELF